MKPIFTLSLFISLLFTLYPGTGVRAQCSGNLGENIFTDGDFGSGERNVLATDPGIAPGFQYQTTPPPNDGFYTITNDMRNWSNTFGTWDAFPDNSNDPDGYMMVVNAAFEPGKFYEQVVEGLCENTEYQFTADVRNVLRRGSNNILPNVSFLIDNDVQFTTGNIPEDQRWNTYGFSFSTAPGQTSVVLALSNNAPGGIGNDLAIDNIAFRACGPEARVEGAETLTSICEDGDGAILTADIIGDQYDTPALQWERSLDEGLTWETLPGENGLTVEHNLLASGFYHYRYLLANGAGNLTNEKCRVVSNVKVIFVVPKRWDVTDTICAGLTYESAGNRYTRSGVFIDTLTNFLGCDSIVTLDLTVVPDPGLVPDFELVNPSCSDRADGSIALLGVAGAAAPFSLVFRDSLVNQRFFSGLTEDTFSYVITDRFGCSVRGAVDLASPFPFTVNFSRDRVATDLGDVVRLNLTSDDTVTNYLFTPPGLIPGPADSTYEELVFTPTASTVLRLDAVSINGCLASDSVLITVTNRRDIYLPDAFSPNADGVNDFFSVFAETPRVVAYNNFRIHDRWGREVFFSATGRPGTEVDGWDGTVSGETAMPGTYVYSVEVVFLDGVRLPVSGSLVLLR